MQGHDLKMKGQVTGLSLSRVTGRGSLFWVRHSLVGGVCKNWDITGYLLGGIRAKEEMNSYYTKHDRAIPRGGRLMLAGLLMATTVVGLSTTAGAGAATRYPVGRVDGAEPSGMGPPGAHALAGYHQTYVTDFLGSTIPDDWDTYQGQPGGDPGGLFAQSHDIIGGGLLDIKTYQDLQYGNEWVTGGICLCGLAPETYGAYFERSRLTGPGPTGVALLWPDANVWPPEIDFNETGGGVRGSTATVHWITATNPNAQTQTKVAINMTKWHTWGVIWTRTKIIYTVDGRVWGSMNKSGDVPTIPMHLSLQSQTWCESGWACPTKPESMEIDWVSVYAPGAAAVTTSTTTTTTTTTTTAPNNVTTTTAAG
jgi:hypothetical protein